MDAARRAGADYADARVGSDETESLTVRNQEMEGIDRSRPPGVGVRVLVDGYWGFAATARMDEAEIAAHGRSSPSTSRGPRRASRDPVRLAESSP